MRARPSSMIGYVPLAWEADSMLTRDEQAIVEAQRRDLWRHGVRTEPLLTRMAFEFGAVICMQRAAKLHGIA
jgi:hypothetical protein